MEPHGIAPTVVVHVGTDDTLVQRAVESVTEVPEEVTVRTVADGADAFDQYDEEEVDCLVCEATRSDGSGMAVLKDTRRRAPDLPVLVVMDDEQAVDDALAAGARDVVVRRDGSNDATVLARRLEHALAASTPSPVSESVVDTLDDVFYLLDTDGTLRHWNRSTQETAGYTDEELAGMQALEFFEGDDRERIVDAVTTVLDGESTRTEADLVTKDGECVPLEFTGTPVTDADGTVTGIVGIGRDISKREERERRLELAETVFQEAQDAIFLVDVVDGEFYIERVNPAYEAATGLDTASMEGQTPRELLGEELGRDVEERYRECLDRGEPIEYDEEFPVDGELREWHTSLAPVFDDGEARKLVGMARDVTERNERVEILEQIKQNATDVVWMTGPNKDTIDFATDAYEDIWGRSPESLVQSPTSFVDAVHPDDRDRVERALAAQRSDPDAYGETYRVVQPDGEVRWVRDRASGVYEDGDLSRIVGVASDVTARKEREEELRLKKRAIDEAPVGISIYNVDGTGRQMAYANDGFVQVTGYGQEEAIGEDLSILFGTETDPTERDQLLEAFDRGLSRSQVLLLYRKDDRPFWGRVSLAPVTDETGDVTRFISFLQDVTAEKEHEQDIERRLDEFGDVLAEELRTPIEDARDAIQAALENEEMHVAKTADESLERVEKLIDDLTTVHSFAVKSREVSETTRGDFHELQ